MKHAALLFVCAFLGLGLSIQTPALGADEPVIGFRGAGKSREQLDAMQLKPFDQNLWSNLSDWAGTAPKPEDLNGKVVLIVTWASWYKLSAPAMRFAESLYEKDKDKGLVVIGVHDPRGAEHAAESAKSLGVTFPWALDKGGKFRAGLRADQDPNIYFIDRSGNLRYAQTDLASMETAANYLLKETAQQAADYPKSLERARAAADKAKWRTQDFPGPIPGQERAVDFAEPDDDAYKAARWPYMVGKVETDAIMDKIKQNPPHVKAWPDDDWVPVAAERAGKLVVIYYIDPQEVATLNVIPAMNRLHDEYLRDVVVAASMYKEGQNAITGNNSYGGGDDEAKLVQRNKDMLGTLQRTRSLNHYITPHTIRFEDFELGGGGMVPRFAKTQDETGFAVILSSDLKMRWVGNPYDQDLRVALDKLLAVDPGVRARRKAEDKHTK